jgi:heme-degrading monooxygenase HmoA
VFIHLVLFRIRKKNVSIYRADCKIWKKAARRERGFLGYRTLARTNEKNQYASYYLWKTEKHHRQFMNKHHDRLVSLSSCPVEVLGYYNYQTL